MSSTSDKEIIKRYVEQAVNEEDHLGDCLLYCSDYGLQVQAVIKSLIQKGDVGLYHYVDNKIIELTTSEAIEALQIPENWKWSHRIAGRIDYFLYTNHPKWWEYKN